MPKYKGTRIYSFRLRPRIMKLVQWTLEKRNAWPRCRHWSLSDFVRIALLEKVEKMERSRRKPRRVSPGTAR